MQKKNPVIFVMGPTASGKSSWALQMAQELKAVIVNCDSVQVYSGLSIGAAMPTKQEMSLVPHYLYSYVKPPIEMTAGEYSRDFYSIVEKVPEHQPIFIVGGTGFYFQAIEKGMYSVEKTPPEIQKAILNEFKNPNGAEKLYTELQEKDPEAAAKIHRADHYRLGRALELIRTHQLTLTEIRQNFTQKTKTFPYPLLKTGLEWPKEVLRQRIAQRTQQMIEGGLIKEVQSLLDQGLEGWAPLSSVGYRETVDYLKSGQSLQWLNEQITTHTQQLAKKQKTWFQRDPETKWFAGQNEFELFKKTILTFCRTNPS